MVWLQQVIRTFFFSIDSNLYGLIEVLYNFIIDISRTSVLSQGVIKEFADRIQLLLGVFMLFKVSLSLIMYIINPDDFTDKSKGVYKILQNIILSLLLLVLVPYAFNIAYDLQARLLERNVLAQLILGGDEDQQFINSGGQKLAYSVMIPFFKPNSGYEELDACYTLYDNNDPNKFNEKCKEAMENVLYNNTNDDDDKLFIGNYVSGIENRSLALTFRLLNAKTYFGGDKFVIDYKILLSTAAAVVVCLLLITFCMDVALRSVKLAFFQLIAPIPIISFIDPKQGKEGIFKKWYTACFSTYLSLFIRLLALYFALYLIDQVTSVGFVDVITGQRSQSDIINLFMIIGILMFVKQLPKILEGLGIKLDAGGKFTLNPLKKFEEEAFGGKRITGAIGGMSAGLIGGHGVGGRLAGMFGGAVRGFSTNKGYQGGVDRQADVNRKLRQARINGAGFWGQRVAVLSSRYGLDDYDLEGEATQLRVDKRQVELSSRELEAKNKKIEENKKDLQSTIAPQKSLISKKEAVKSSIEDMESFVKSQIEGNKAGAYSAKYRDLQHIYNMLKDHEGDTLKSAYTDAKGKTHSIGTVISRSMIDDADAAIGEYLNRSGKKDVMSEMLSGSYSDKSALAEFQAKLAGYHKAVDIYNSEENVLTEKLLKGAKTYDEIHGQITAINQSVTNKKTDITEAEAAIEKFDREIQANQVNQKVNINGKYLSLEEAQRDISEREKDLKDKQDQRKLNRETARDRSLFGSK